MSSGKGKQYLKTLHVQSHKQKRLENLKSFLKIEIRLLYNHRSLILIFNYTGKNTFIKRTHEQICH